MVSDRLIADMNEKQCHDAASELDDIIGLLTDMRKGYDVLEQLAHAFGSQADDMIGKFERVCARFENAATDKLIQERESNEQS